MSRVLVVSADRVGPEMAGPGIRAWELASVLSGEHQVTLLAIGGAGLTHPSVRMLDGTSFSRNDVETLAIGQDVAILQGAALRRYPFLASIPTLALVMDLYDPFLFEILLLRKHDPPLEQERYYVDNLNVLLEQLGVGDFFICATKRQRDYWVGMLAAAGRINPRTLARDESLRRFIDIVPFGVSAPPPRAGAIRPLKGTMRGIGPDDLVLLWGGGLWDWLDPLTVIRAMHVVSATHPHVKLVFLGTRHPNPVVPPMRVAAEAIRLSRDLGLHGSSVFFNEGWVPYEARTLYFRDADVGVTAHLPSIETRFAFRTRVVDYLAAGLPIIATEGDELAELVLEAGLGRVVEYGDVQGWAAAITELADAPTRRLEWGKRARDVSERFRWGRVAEPLLRFCREPRRAADRQAAAAVVFTSAVPEPPPPPAPARPTYLTRARRIYREGGLMALLRGVTRAVRRLARV